jgi:hypothetical protein
MSATHHVGHAVDEGGDYHAGFNMGRRQLRMLMDRRLAPQLSRAHRTVASAAVVEGQSRSDLVFWKREL